MMCDSSDKDWWSTLHVLHLAMVYMYGMVNKKFKFLMVFGPLVLVSQDVWYSQECKSSVFLCRAEQYKKLKNICNVQLRELILNL